MYTAEFTYHKAGSVAEALSMLAANPEAKLLAGGHSLVPAMKLRLSQPAALIDVSRIAELKGVRKDGNTVVIGAMTTHRDIEFSSVIKADVPLLADAVPQIGDPMVRNRGTVGGSLAHADPAADYPASMLALGAKLKIVSSDGERVVDADDFFTGMFSTAVGEGEMLTEVHVPAGVKGAYEKFSHPASRYAIAGVAVAIHPDGTVRAAMTGAGERAVRLSRLEGAVSGKALDAGAISSACQGLVDAGGLLGDHFASAAYRAHLVDVLARRALSRAAGV